VSPDPLAARQRRVAGIAAAVAAAIPMTALAGWVFGIAPLRGILPDAVGMNPITAVSLLSGALALWFAGRPGLRARVASRCFALVMVVAASGRLLDPLLGGRLGIDLLLYGHQVQQMVPPARMSFGGAISYFCVGTALLLYRSHLVKQRSPRWLVVPAALLALLATAGYLYGSRVLFDIPALKPMALNTAMALLVLCLGITALPPAAPPVSSLLLPGAAGTMARTLLPAAFLLPFMIGWVRVQAERAGWFDLGFGTALMVVITSGLMTLLVLLSVLQVQRAEAAQQSLEGGLRASERRLFQILEAVPIGVYVLDRAGHPYYNNQRSTEILGSSLVSDAKVDDLSTQYHVHRAGTGELYPPEQLPIALALRGERVYTTDLELHRPDRIVPIEVWSAPVTAADGRIEFAISAFNDITERQEAKRQIEDLNLELKGQVAELASVNGELETFSYSVSHDLRAPLRAIDGFSRMLAEDHSGVLDPEALRLLERISNNVQRMGNLIDDLLRFSRLSRKELEAAPLDMSELVRTVVGDLSRTHERQLSVVVGQLPPACGDADLLRQVWINLIDNGLKYSGKRGDPLVEIGGKTNGVEATYWVRDNGVGFDMTYAGKLFGVFQRLHSQDEFEGTGVGLAIVQRIVHRHGGRVWAEGKPEQGATFSFTLPVGGTHAAE